MSPFQIVAISILGLGALAAIAFTVAFVIVLLQKEKSVETNRVERVVDDEVNEIDLDAMLKKLEEVSVRKAEVKQPVAQVEIEQEPQVVQVEEEELEELGLIEEEPVIIEPQVEKIVQVVKEEPVITTVVSEQDEKSGPEFDYRVRLEKIKESQAKIDRDLEKTTRAILKYERTIRRKERNQKMLDRRAHELTNLNLLMYSVTDIKNVDAEKKTRQEELTKHIAELKASIQDAENYLEANKEKHENNIKLSEYLTHEKTRYADEVRELEEAIASGKYFDDDGENK